MKTACTARIVLLSPRILIGFALYAAGLVLALAPMNSGVAGDKTAAELRAPVPAQAPGRWKVTGSMANARESHKATLLPDGRVLVAGGVDRRIGTLRSAELYDPATGTWTPTGSLATGRVYHTATLLPNGQVLVAGGGRLPTGNLASAELY